MAAPPNIQIKHRINEREKDEYSVSGEHKGVDELKKYHQNQYIVKRVAAPDERTEDWKTTVPYYPSPVEFLVSRVAHVTTKQGLNGILDSGGFKGGKRDPEVGPLLWWGLVIRQEEIAGAEERYLDKEFPGVTEEEKRRHWPFLHKFTTSPVFKGSSRYGNFRFTLSLEEVLQAYSTQFCDGKEPILRVWETVVYKQEIMYSVLVHSPDVHDYDENYPEELPGNGECVCAYHNGKIIWRAQAISEKHIYRLIRHETHCSEEHVDKVFYVWDHVTLAFHIPEGEKLSFPQEKLIGCLTTCDIGKPKLISDNQVASFDEAHRIVEEIRNRKRVDIDGPLPEKM